MAIQASPVRAALSARDGGGFSAVRWLCKIGYAPIPVVLDDMQRSSKS